MKKNKKMFCFFAILTVLTNIVNYITGPTYPLLYISCILIIITVFAGGRALIYWLDNKPAKGVWADNYVNEEADNN